jgi:sodium-dependent dicarboxylate transporter 2/3/5
LVLGPALAAVVYYLLPGEQLNESADTIGGLSESGRAVTCVGTLMAVLWITEALPIAVTALLPITLFPLLTGGGVTVKAATAPYAHELIYLFMGGFLLALAMQEWGLHRRIALHTILVVGTHPVRLVGGFMLASAFLSMWVSNTATVVMMLPIALSVVELVRRQLQGTDVSGASAPDRLSHFAICLMLGTAYGSSIGGVGTLIGTPPNAMLAAFLSREYDIEISFVRWMAVGVPFVVVFLPIAWFVLTRLVFPIRVDRIPGGRHLIRQELDAQGPMSNPERAVLVVFGLAAVAWMTRPLLVEFQLPGGSRPFAGLTDPGIAIGAAILLFVLPVNLNNGVFLLSWRRAKELPWGVLILFGGGLSLASAVKTTGVADYIARGVSGFHALPVPVLVVMVVTMIVFLTELTSNTATTATFLPILAAVAVGLGYSPMMLVVPMAIGASCAFMMPVATPPNAIVFSSGELTIPQMCKAGFWLNLTAISLIMALTYSIIIRVLVVSVS